MDADDITWYREIDDSEMIVSVEECANALRARGYLVIPKERRKLLTVQTVFDDTVLAADGLKDYMLHHQGNALGRAIVEGGAVVTETIKRNSGYPFNRDETVLRSTCAVIIPKEIDARSV